MSSEKTDGFRFVSVALIFFALGGVLVFAFLRIKPTINKLDKSQIDSSSVVCTREAQLCPDGSTVGRVGPNCEFAPCPGNNSMSQGNSGSCVNYCGDGKCQKTVCETVDCPCVESQENCPIDCVASNDSEIPEIPCPEDAKVCQDGSTVVRVGPNCEFSPCPEE